MVSHESENIRVLLSQPLPWRELTLPPCIAVGQKQSNGLLLPERDSGKESSAAYAASV